ncbi:MAG: ribonuclease D [Alphaproteobacteria bacterium]|nr:ribonuclease D [Alphaproteobacteria bacterium]
MTLIHTAAELKKLCEKLKKHPFIAVDTEFTRERTFYAELSLIQLAGPDGKPHAIDMLSPWKKKDLAPLWSLFKAKKILKIFHAARQDLEILLQWMGELPTPVYDTQIAAQFCGFPEQIGFEPLARMAIGAKIDKSHQYSDWSKRPLSDAQLEYALDDVRYLAPLYKHLADKIEKLGRTGWVKPEMDALYDENIYNPPLENLWLKLKVRKPSPREALALQGLCATREEWAKEDNVPRGRIIRDEAIVELAQRLPKDEKDMGRLRNFPRDISFERAEKILALVKYVRSAKNDDCPKPPTAAQLSPAQNLQVDALKIVLKVVSYEADLAPRMIASNDDLEQLVLKGKKAKIPCNDGWRAEIFAAPALEFLKGKRSLKGTNNGLTFE